MRHHTNSYHQTKTELKKKKQQQPTNAYLVFNNRIKLQIIITIMGLNENSMKFNNKMLKQKQCVINYDGEQKKTHTAKKNEWEKERERERTNKGDREKMSIRVVSPNRSQNLWMKIFHMTCSCNEIVKIFRFHLIRIQTAAA